MNIELCLHQRQLTLQRYPIRNNETLQAWDSADEYLINTLQSQTLDEHASMLLFNDGFGALANWFAPLLQITSVSDSWIAQQACLHNLATNSLAGVSLLSSLDEQPVAPRWVLLKVPKNSRLLAWQLHQICRIAGPDTQVIAAGKVKEIHTSTLQLFEKYLGPTHTSLAVKKSRLIYCQPNKQLQVNMPTLRTWDVPEYQLTLTNHANVFSGESLDIGGRFLLAHIPVEPQLKHIIDLGCGNGVIGIQAAKLNPQAKVTCVDESYMAVASCQLNAKANLSDPKQLQAKVNNCLDNEPADSADLVLCNPPFHQQNAITDHIAWQMFTDSKRTLHAQGRIIVIGNRQLGYGEKLKRIFGNCQTLAKNNKFTIYQAVK
ncbi:methyltransferase [Motilimonas pumila]|uniref:Ribosomal RNA large subunit methyltransferase G n=1 Tax=Motilimonas pumila TaxID=2303987 RepID=A0A418Y9V9_9GAMM|nr:methyltransferase [Motilimonas pumila]RJG38296.1 methyltransferase domain-containing protein [Motilimonas pumila]